MGTTMVPPTLEKKHISIENDWFNMVVVAMAKEPAKVSLGGDLIVTVLLDLVRYFFTF